MEAFSTYTAIIEIALHAAKDYNENTDISPQKYAEIKTKCYLSKNAPNFISENKFYVYLLKEYKGTIKNHIVQSIELKLCNKSNN